MDKQKTWQDFSPRLKAMTRFVVQSQEAEEMERLFPGQVIALPEHIKKLSPTRQWIWENFKNRRYLTIDDDSDFHLKYLVDGKFRNLRLRPEHDEHWEDLLITIENLMDDGYHFGGIKFTGHPPNIKHFPIQENSRIVSAFFIDGPNCPEDINWNRFELSQDFDVSLQWASKGLKSCLVTKYNVASNSYAKGGCSNYRTLEMHNDVMKRLQKQWPEYITLREKTIPLSQGVQGWGGQKVLRATIKMNQCYMDALKNKKNGMNKFEKAEFASEEVRNLNHRPYSGGGGTQLEATRILEIARHIDALEKCNVQERLNAGEDIEDIADDLREVLAR